MASLDYFPFLGPVNEYKVKKIFSLLCISPLILVHVCISGARDVGGAARSAAGDL